MFAHIDGEMMATGTTKTEIRLTRAEINQALVERYWPKDSKVTPLVRLRDHASYDCQVIDAVLSGEEKLFEEKAKQ